MSIFSHVVLFPYYGAWRVYEWTQLFLSDSLSVGVFVSNKSTSSKWVFHWALLLDAAMSRWCVHRRDERTSNATGTSFQIAASSTINKLFIMFLRFVSFSHGFLNFFRSLFDSTFLLHFRFVLVSRPFGICYLHACNSIYIVVYAFVGNLCCLLTFITFDEVRENYILLFLLRYRCTTSVNKECCCTFISAIEQFVMWMCLNVSSFIFLFSSHGRSKQSVQVYKKKKCILIKHSKGVRKTGERRSTRINNRMKQVKFCVD